MRYAPFHLEINTWQARPPFCSFAQLPQQTCSLMLLIVSSVFFIICIRRLKPSFASLYRKSKQPEKRACMCVWACTCAYIYVCVHARRCTGACKHTGKSSFLLHKWDLNILKFILLSLFSLLITGPILVVSCLWMLMKEWNVTKTSSRAVSGKWLISWWKSYEQQHMVSSTAAHYLMNSVPCPYLLSLATFNSFLWALRISSRKHSCSWNRGNKRS